MRRIKSKNMFSPLSRMAPRSRGQTIHASSSWGNASTVSKVSIGGNSGGSSSQSLTNLTRPTNSRRKGRRRPEPSPHAQIRGRIAPRSLQATLGKRRDQSQSRGPKTVKPTNDIYSEFSFSALNLSRTDLVDAASEMVFETYVQMRGGQRKVKNIEGDIRVAVREFVVAVEAKYNESNFHNFTHAVDVAQLMYTFINKFFKHRLRKSEGFYLIVISLCHDISHPGAGTPFLKENKCLPPGNSLEQFHISQTLDLIKNGELSLFGSSFLQLEKKNELMEYAEHLIDATDISKDAEYKRAAENVVCGKTSKLPIEHLAILMKVSDLANVVRDFKDAHSWSANLQVELTAEGQYKAAKEQMQKLLEGAKLDSDCTKARFERVKAELSEIQRRIRANGCDVLNDNLAKNTMGFIKNIVLPLSKVLESICDQAGSEYGVRLRKNMEAWREFEKR